jgi:Histidine kinase-, DNA gyrase B-, and HSP90-like ATPase
MYEIERDDWTPYRSIEGLCRKSGSDTDRLASVVIKEIVDNSLDAANNCDVRLTDGTVVVQDEGPGINGDDEEIARRFSINRPMTSSKYFRLPTRGALGNGLRVVVGAVAATGGKLFVSTRGRRLEIITDPSTGKSRSVPAGGYEGRGTRIEVTLGPPLELTPEDLLPAERAIVAARAQTKKYTGKASAHWHDTESFHDLLLSIKSEETTLRSFIANFDGCSGKAAEIVGEFVGRLAKSLSREEAGRLLARAKAAARRVEPRRLGELGEGAFPGAYAKEADFVLMPRCTDGSRALLPVVVEAWAEPDDDGSQAHFMVNGTPCIADADARFHAKSKTTMVYAPGFRFYIKKGETGMWLHVSIITPHMPMTNEGKGPWFNSFASMLESVIEKAVKRARRLRPKEHLKPRQKTVVFAHMEEQIVAVSDNRRFRYNWRQVYYRLRPFVKEEAGVDLDWRYFSQSLVTEYEEINGEEPQAYRDPRGTFYSPHAGETLPLGTIQVEEYRRPEYRFDKILFVEKEGFFEALKAEGWPERNDCALMTSKGQPSRAARDLIDLIGETDEPVLVFCLHDCDAAGTLILQSLQEETRARGRRTIPIINLGLDVDEALALAAHGIVEIEDVSHDKTQGVADYVTDDDSRAWLQRHRVELNAFTTRQFIEWLDEKLKPHFSKVVPPKDVLERTLGQTIDERLRESITNKVLAEAGIDDQVREARAQLDTHVNQFVGDLPERIATDLEKESRRDWRHFVTAYAEKIISALFGLTGLPRTDHENRGA